MYLREVIPPGPRAAREAEKAARRLGTQLDERRSPRTSATVSQMLDKYFEVIDRDASTVAHVRRIRRKAIEHHTVTLPAAAMAVVLDDAGENVLLSWRHRFVPDLWNWELPGAS